MCRRYNLLDALAVSLTACILQRHDVAQLLLTLKLLAQTLLLGRNLRQILLATLAHQSVQDSCIVRRIARVNHHARILGSHLHRRMYSRCGCTADDDGNLLATRLQLAQNAYHLVKRGGDQTTQTDGIGSPSHGLIDDLCALDHYAQVLNLESVTSHHDRNDILTDVVHVALDRRHNESTCRLRAFGSALLDIGRQHAHGTLHHTRTLDHLRQEHLALTKQTTHALHCRHQQLVDHRQRRAQLVVALHSIGLDIFGHTLQHRPLDALGKRALAPLLGIGISGG